MSFRIPWRGNAAEQVARDEVDIVVAKLMSQLGFTHGTHTTIDLLSDLAVRHLLKISQNVRIIKEHCGRTGAIVKDVEFAYEKMHVDLDEMNEYMRQNRPLSPRPIAQFPAVPPKKEARVTQIAPSSKTSDHLPSWVPPIYVPDLTTVASSSKYSIKSETDSFPDFMSFTAFTLGLQRREIKQPETQSDEESRSQPVSRAPSLTDVFISPRPCSGSSGTTVPMFKRRKVVKRAHTDHIPNEPSTSKTAPVDTSQSGPLLFTAKELAYSHRPVMTAILSGTAAPAPASAPVKAVPEHFVFPPRVPKSSTLTYDELNEDYNRSLSPQRIVQMAILKSMFTLDAELSDELKKAFEYINNEDVNEPAVSSPTTYIQSQQPSSSSEPVYRIVPQEKSMDMPSGTLPPLKIKISRASISGEPSPAGTILSNTSSSGPTSPKPKRHKHKKNKHKKDKYRALEPPPEQALEEAHRPIKLKIRFGTASS